jgi:hypothetical protein
MQLDSPERVTGKMASILKQSFCIIFVLLPKCRVKVCCIFSYVCKLNRLGLKKGLALFFN